MKVCRRCGEEKPRAEFHRRRANRDGLQSYCKQCNIAQWSERYKTDPRHRAKDIKRWKDKPQARRAHAAVARALRSGELEKPGECESCQKPAGRIEGHHDDYRQVLDVKWLCPECHYLQPSGINAAG